MRDAQADGLLADTPGDIDAGQVADSEWAHGHAPIRESLVDLPEIGLMGTSWGLGFERFDTPEGTLVGHDGNTIGQAAFLRMVPEAGLAVALLTNGGDAFSVYREVVGHVLEELAGLPAPQLPVPPAHPEPVDASRRWSSNPLTAGIRMSSTRQRGRDAV